MMARLRARGRTGHRGIVLLRKDCADNRDQEDREAIDAYPARALIHSCHRPFFNGSGHRSLPTRLRQDRVLGHRRRQRDAGVLQDVNLLWTIVPLEVPLADTDEPYVFRQDVGDYRISGL